MNINLEIPPYSASFIEALVELNNRVFGRIDPDYVNWRMANMPDMSAFVAIESQQLRGYKIGYAMSRAKYYSWLGGVDLDHRRKGIASELMERQHQWISERGYSQIETAADQDNTAMAKLNLAHGFRICGIRTEPTRTQIIYLKELQ